MRLCKLILWDIRFQIKYGFYFLYFVLTVAYIFILSVLPEVWQENIAAILIFSDPAALGLFFMGAIILLEKSQRVPCALAVSPIKVSEYVLSKIVSLGTVSIGVAFIIAVSVGAKNLCWVAVGTILSGTIFTLLGIIVATKISSLNQFVLWMVPIELIGFVPAILHLMKLSPAFLRYYPSNVCVSMISGEAPAFGGLMVVIVLLAVLMYFSCRCVLKMWRRLGGIKL